MPIAEVDTSHTTRSWILIVHRSLHKGLDVSRRDQPDGMTKLADLASPMVSAAAGLHRHRAGRLTCQEREDLVPPQLPAEQDRARCIGTVNLEDTLRQIHADCANFTHGRLPQVVF